MNEEQIDQHRDRNIHANMNEEQIDQHRDRNIHENMNEEQINQHRARSSTVAFKKYDQEWDYQNCCPACNCLYLKSETNRKVCCNNGEWLDEKSYFPYLNPLPQAIRHCALNRIEHFGTKSGFYNNLFSMAVTGVDNGRKGVGYETMNMKACVKLNGRTYHRFPDSNMQSCGIANIIYDASLTNHVNEINSRVEGRKNKEPIVDKSLVDEIKFELGQINSYIQDCHIIKNYLEDLSSLNHTVPIYESTLNIQTHMMEVGILLNQEHRNVYYQYMTKENKNVFLNYESREIEPLCYPLFFTNGEQGWGKELLRNHKLGRMEYVRSRLLQPEVGLYAYNRNGDQYLNVNRFQLMTRLTQYWLLDHLSAHIDSQLSYQSSNQEYISGYNNRDDTVIDQSRHTQNDTSKTFLSDSLTGSPRHRKQLACNALAIVADLKRTHCFTTMTVDPNSPEVLEQLIGNETAFDRMEIVCRVFKAKKDALVHNIKNGKYFDGRASYIIHVIEYQHRGLPHVHIVYRIENGPDHNNEEECIEWIDRYFCSTVPDLDENSTEEDIAYHKLVVEKMIHKCHGGDNGCIDEDTGLCKKKFNYILNNETHFDEKKYPVYKRLKHEDCKVVVHNRQMLLDLKCHCNTEFSASTYSVIYLYKYLFKGNKKVQMYLDNINDVNEDDEIKLYLRGRMLSSMEACWRAMGYQTYPASTPKVITIKMKSVDQLDFLHRNRKTCDFEIWLNRPAILCDVRFIDFFRNYDYNYKCPVRFINRIQTLADLNSLNSADDFQCCVLRLPHVPNDIYLYEMKQDDKVIRLNPVPPDCGESWYFRLLVRFSCFTSHADAKVHNNITYNTYQEVCQAKGLLRDQNEAEYCFLEALTDSVPAQLRSLFVLLTLQGFPTIQLFNNHYGRMLDFESCPTKDDLMIDLYHRFSAENKNMENYGFPKPPVSYYALFFNLIKIILIFFF